MTVERIALSNVRVFDGERIREPGTVVIDGGVLGDDPTGARRVDCGGATLLPGLIDCHVHLTGRSALDRLGAFGVTTALDMGTPAPLIDGVRDLPGSTDVRGSTLSANAPGSLHSRIPGAGAGRVAGPAEAADFVADRIAEGADYIKIIAERPGLDQETLAALVAAAHRYGKLTVAHAAAFEDIAMAQEAGVDILTHAPLDTALDDAAVARAAADERICVPTLSMMEGIVEQTAPPGAAYPPARASVAALYRAGVPILAGTDANEAAGVPANIPYGDSLHHELELLVDAGLSTVDALRAATSSAAHHFRLTDRGVIAPGRRADLVLVDGDPVADIRATRRIGRVWFAGVESDPA